MTNDRPAIATADDPGRRRELLSVAKGAGFIAGGRVFSAATRLLMAVFLARWLGADDYGLYILVVSVGFAASGIASFGLDTGMERYVAVNSRHGDERGLRGTLQVGLAGTLVSSLIVAVALLVFADPIAEHVFEETRLTSLLVIGAILAPLLALLTLLHSALVGFKRMGEGTLGQEVVQPVVRFACLALLALAGMTAFRAGIAIILSYGVAAALLLYFVQRAAPSAIVTGPAHRETREIAAFSFPFWFSGLLRIVRTRLQPLLLGILGSTANVGVFSVVTGASTFGRIANLSINKALRPTLAQLHDAGDREEIGRLYATTTRWTLSVNLPVFLIMALTPESLLAVFGPNFTAGTSALVIVAFAEVANAATGMCGAIIAMSKRSRMKLANSFVWMLVSLAANVLLIPRWGMTGAAIALLISTITINIIRAVELWIIMRIIPWDRHIWKPAVAALATGASILGLLTLLPDVLGLGQLAGVSITAVVVYFAFLALLGFEPDDELVLGRVRAKIARLAIRR